MEIDHKMDQYEKQLYTLFASYDSALNGSLSREALEKLCNTLQLENRGRQLIELLSKDSNELCVTFPMFRDGLLTVLGNESNESSVKKLDKSELNSGEDSSGREVSPKFIFGSKKYGRRSKPSRSSDSADYISDIVNETENSSVEAFDPEIKNSSVTPIERHFGNKKRKSNKLKRSLSFSGHRISDNIDSTSNSVLSRANKQLSLSKTEHFDTVPPLPYQVTTRDTSNTQSVLGILDCNSNTQHCTIQPICFETIIKNTDAKGLDSCLQTMANNEMINVPSQRDSEDLVTSETVMELWEAAGIPQAHQLLCDLGFSDRDANLSELVLVLEEEIQGMLNNLQENFSASLITLFQAVLCLYQYEKKSLKLSLSHTYAERDKLRTDLTDANQRAILLAHEVDDNHAKMENAAKHTFKQLEQKHSEIVKLISGQFASEKEQFTSTISLLDNKIALMESEESKLKSQILQLSDENIRLEKEFNGAQEQIYELLEIKTQLSKDIKLLMQDQHNTQDSIGKENELSSLENQIDKLQKENIVLNDKNDELCAELEIMKSADKSKFVENNYSDMTQCNVSKNELNFNGDKSDEQGIVSFKISDLSNSEENHKYYDKKKYQCDLSSFESNTFNKSSTESSLNVSIDNGRNSLDTLFCIKQLTPENVEELITIFKATSNTVSGFFVQSQIKHFYVGLYLLIRRIMDDIKTIMDRNNPLESNNLITVVKNLVTELCNIHIEDQFLLISLTNSENQHCASTDKVNHQKQHSDESQFKTALNNSDFLRSQLIDLEQKLKNLSSELDKERLQSKEQKTNDTEKYSELESNMELLKNEYDKCEDYWASKLNEERDIFDQEQKITDEKFAELLSKLSEYEEQLTLQDGKNDRFDGPLSTIEETYNLEKQFTDLEDEFEEFKDKAEQELEMKNSEISQLKEQIEQLENSKVCTCRHENISMSHSNISDTEHNLLAANVCEKEYKKDNPCIINGSSDSQQSTELYTGENAIEKISSPIDYLWNQSTISSPLPNRGNVDIARDYRNPAFFKQQSSVQDGDYTVESPPEHISNGIMPIQKPTSSMVKPSQACQTNNGKYFNDKKIVYCSDLEEELQGRRKEVQQLEATRARLDAEVRNLNMQRSNPQNQVGAAALKAVALENYCRQLQTALRQQHSYAEAVMQQSIAAHRSEVGVLRQRLAASDLLVRDLFVENCQLARSLTTSITK